jgi:hypothetical protein
MQKQPIEPQACFCADSSLSDGAKMLRQLYIAYSLTIRNERELPRTGASPGIAKA